VHPINRTSHWVFWLACVSYISLIGIFAIEELDGRDETMRLILAEEARVGIEAVGRKGDGAPAELSALRGLRQRLTALIVSGAVQQPQGTQTLKAIHCELVRTVEPGTICPPTLPSPGSGDRAINLMSSFFLKSLGEVSGSGHILAILIITASIGGALITLSIQQPIDVAAGAHHRKEGDQLQDYTLQHGAVGAIRTVLRAMGGGLVCYLAVNGGSIPLSVAEIAKTTHPATASLFGFLAGMFSDRVFRLLSSLVDAFIDKVNPPLQKRDAVSSNN
jgi:hypothetical protein